ncbi:tubulin-specific chaperone C-like [Rhipicephalus sanguineus]|uniref:tubulin-specific chaperone C-like n=2 Tax=Rhipicephalus sanguineus TaxID=34632 RepID=UPI001894A096|nr:tubulin-specific chaperone C-like [Rhipicephalus sanguineus]
MYDGDDKEKLDEEFSEAEIRVVLSSINTRSSPGPDRVTSKTLRNLDDESITRLTAYVNECWRVGCLPNAWKRARVVMIPKPGNQAAHTAARGLTHRAAADSVAASTSESVRTQQQPECDARLEGKCEPGPSFPAGTLKNACTVGFQGRSGETLMLSEVGGKDTELDSLDDCQVTIQGCPATLFARRLRNCHIRCGPVASSVFVEECESCTFLVACHQLRVHDSLKCEFRVHVQTRSIIEDSNELLFGKYDFVYDGDEQDWCASHLDRTVNNWNKVDDFNWLAADKPSPNWELSRV